MKVILTHGYFINEDPSELRIMKPYPPLGILYISAYLNAKGIKNEIFDTTFSSKIELKKHLIDVKPDYTAIYVNLMTKLNVLEIIKFIKSRAELINTKIILGGPDVRYNAEEFLNYGADYVVIGEGEETIYDLLSTVGRKQNKDIIKIKGIAFINSDGKPFFTSERSLIKNIDDLPMPNREGINIIDYQNAWKRKHDHNAISVSTMRGCPYTCKWCSRAVYGLTYRRRSPKKVIEELKIIQSNYDPDSIWFVDDVFTISHKWLFEFKDEVVKNNLKIAYECITRADRLNDEVISTLKKSGCSRVWIGAESGSQKIIDAMDRRVKIKQVQAMINLSKKYGIETGTFIMLGYPGETEKDIEDTINHLRECNPDYFTITLAYPIKGTEFFHEIQATQKKAFNWEKNVERERDFKRTYPSNYYKFAIRRVVNEVKFHQKQNKGIFKFDSIKYKSKSVAAKAGMWWMRSKKWLS